jgi:hypothetical protein
VNREQYPNTSQRDVAKFFWTIGWKSIGKLNKEHLSNTISSLKQREKEREKKKERRVKKRERNKEREEERRKKGTCCRSNPKLFFGVRRGGLSRVQISYKTTPKLKENKQLIFTNEHSK